MGILENTLLFVKKGTVEGIGIGCGIESEVDADDDCVDTPPVAVAVDVVFNGGIGTLRTGDDGWRL